MNFIPPIAAWICVVIAAIAALTDSRTGKIPNWLTFSGMALGPILWAVYGGFRALATWPMGASFLGSLLSGLGCGGVLYFGLHRKRMTGGESAIGLGDVKLFAALGAVGLVHLGMEAMFYSVCVATAVALTQLAWRGMLLTTLANAVFIMFNPILPKARRREISRENLSKLRFGPPIFLGTLIAVLSERANRFF
jgi:prepilin peptidase CpaA